MRARITALLIIALIGFAYSAQAEVVIDVVETGGDVVFTASGFLNLNAWTYSATEFVSGMIDPSSAVCVLGPFGSVEVDSYVSPVNFAGPGSFGPLGGAAPTSGTGGLFGLSDPLTLAVPLSYVSGSPLSGSSTYVGQTIGSLGMIHGSYTWTWGSGADADSITLNVGPQPPAVVTFDGATDTAILVENLDVEGDKYTVTFVPTVHAYQVYGPYPGTYTFTDLASATAARNALASVLSSAGATAVGDGVADSSVFNIGFLETYLQGQEAVLTAKSNLVGGSWNLNPPGIEYYNDYGPPTTYAIFTPGPFFSDGFETGDTTGWSSTVGGVALKAQALDQPLDAVEIDVRIGPLDTTERVDGVLLSGLDATGDRLFSVSIQHRGNETDLAARVRRNASSWHVSEWTPAEIALRTLGVEWRRSLAGLSDGHLVVTIDRVPVIELTGLDNASSAAVVALVTAELNDVVVLE